MEGEHSDNNGGYKRLDAMNKLWGGELSMVVPNKEKVAFPHGRKDHKAITPLISNENDIF